MPERNAIPLPFWIIPKTGSLSFNDCDSALILHFTLIVIVVPSHFFSSHQHSTFQHSHRIAWLRHALPPIPTTRGTHAWTLSNHGYSFSLQWTLIIDDNCRTVLT
ncbi:hypothetical protein CC2G_001857 [Coprinopsis cinerea AmutBmut pab1-1]|nr:hypothetical protein CC2G_001857 [Coprinopsis cinerea AmutBmut pab1-1]